MNKPGLEIIETAQPRDPFRAAVFDFDDTLSLLRSGWQLVMINQALEVLEPLCSKRSREGLYEYVANYVDELTGKPTIHQMERLSEEAVKRGGMLVDPELHKHAYTQRLGFVKDQRVGLIQSGESPASAFTVAGAESLLNCLSQHQVQLILCSGTDDDAVQREMGLLGLTKYFTPYIYGAPANDPTFSKGRVLDDMIRQLGIKGGEIVHWSDMLAVRTSVQNRGIGRRLKEFQRQAVAKLGATVIYWTYDPLVARNAHLNFNVFGAVGYNEDHETIYRAGLNIQF